MTPDTVHPQEHDEAGDRLARTKAREAMPVQDVTVVSVPVSDQDRAKAFYVGKLGFELIRDDASVPGIRWVQVSPKKGATALTLVTWFDTMPAGSLRGLVLACDDLDAFCERLRANGVPFDSPPERQPWAIEAVCRDPDGNLLVLQQA
jgi:catechol 2,3-dioxygenase-like lactoylglutathione lyase family enzyme